MIDSGVLDRWCDVYEDAKGAGIFEGQDLRDLTDGVVTVGDEVTAVEHDAAFGWTMKEISTRVHSFESDRKYRGRGKERSH